VFDSNDGKLKIRTGGTWGVANQDPSLRILAKTADQSQGAFAGVDIADLTVPLAANEVIHFHAHLIASASATSIGIQLAINGPASPVEVDATILGWTTGAASLMTGVNAFESYQTNSTSAGAMRRVFEIKGRVICGGTAGTFALRFKPDQVPGSVKIHRGSWLQYFMGAN
jgi:hypothetical protein